VSAITATRARTARAASGGGVEREEGTAMEGIITPYCPIPIAPFCSNGDLRYRRRHARLSLSAVPLGMRPGVCLGRSRLLCGALIVLLGTEVYQGNHSLILTSPVSLSYSHGKAVMALAPEMFAATRSWPLDVWRRGLAFQSGTTITRPNSSVCRG